MKTTLVRASVLALAFAGFAASTVVSHSQKTTVHAPVISSTTPVPMCLPGDPTYCGLH